MKRATQVLSVVGALLLPALAVQAVDSTSWGRVKAGVQDTDPTAAAKKAGKVDVCHYDADAGVFFLINISGNALDKHLDNHGDVLPGAWFADADGDGFGDAAGSAAACPGAGLVDNDGDTDDGDPAINPDAPEVCGDGVDNNSDGQVDEDCAAGCPDGSVAFGDKCYAPGGSVVYQPNLWLAGEAYCADTWGGHLASINSAEENDFVASLGASMIGFSDAGRAVNDFAWFDGSAVSYTNWAPGEPNNRWTSRGTEDCAQLAGGVWNDVPCTDGGPFVCEFTP